MKWGRQPGRVATLLFVSVMASMHDLSADSADLGEMIASRVPSLETGLESDHLTGDWGGLRTRLVERGVHLQGGYTAEGMANVAGGIKRGAVYEALLELALGINLEEAVGWKGGEIRLSTLYPHGNSLYEYVGDLSTVSSIAGYDTFRLFEFWYDQQWEGFSVRFGQLAADKEFATSDYGEVFLNSSFGWPNLAAANIPAPIYPVAALGARLRWQINDAWVVQGAVYDGDPGSEQDNLHGVTWNWNDDEGLLAVMEGSWQGMVAGHAAHYKLGGWVHTGDFHHERLDEAGFSLADPLSSGIPQRLSSNWGLYLTADQAIWNEPDPDAAQGLAFFTRAAGAAPDRNFIGFYLDGGLSYRGLVPARDEDVLAVGVLWVNVGKEARELSRDQNQFGGTDTALLDYELVAELTYRLQLFPCWTVQPDVQFLFHPGGSEEIDNAIVLGIRSTLSF